MEDEGVQYKATFQPLSHFRVEQALDPLPLQNFGEHCQEAQSIPKFVYKPQTEGDWFHFSYYIKNEKRECAGLRCGGIRLVDMFSGAGGMSQGLHSSGFTTVCAVEKDSKGSLAFKRNNPNAIVENRDVNDWLEQCKNDQAYMKLTGDVDHIHASPLCQGVL